MNRIFNATTLLIGALCFSSFAQDRRSSAEHLTTIEPGTTIPVRTNETIDSKRADGQVFTGVVAEDVTGSNGHVAIPRGSQVELVARTASDGDLVVDVDSVVINGERYALKTDTSRVDSREGLGANKRTGKYLGGGAVRGTIRGAIALRSAQAPAQRRAQAVRS
jgi:hypothetical protein